MFVEVPHPRPTTAPARGLLIDPRGTGHYRPLAPGEALAVGPIASARMDKLVAMPAGCLGLLLCRNDGAYEPAGAEYRLHAHGDLAGLALLLDADEDGELDLLLPGLTGPHRLLIRQRDRTFRDDAPPAFAWPGAVRSLVAGDFDNDGHEEILVATAEGNRLFRAPHARHLDGAAAALPPGCDWSVADIDGDGALELTSGGRAFRAPNANARLRVAPRTRFGAPAYGASVRLKARVNGLPRTMLRVLDAGRAHEPVAHFGLGADPALESLTVTWPDGAKWTTSDLTPDTAIRVPYPG